MRVASVCARISRPPIRKQDCPGCTRAGTPAGGRVPAPSDLDPRTERCSRTLGESSVVVENGAVRIWRERDLLHVVRDCSSRSPWMTRTQMALSAWRTRPARSNPAGRPHREDAGHGRFDHGRQAFAVGADGARAASTTNVHPDALDTIDSRMVAKTPDTFPVAPEGSARSRTRSSTWVLEMLTSPYRGIVRRRSISEPRGSGRRGHHGLRHEGVQGLLTWRRDVRAHPPIARTRSKASAILAPRSTGRAPMRWWSARSLRSSSRDGSRCGRRATGARVTPGC